MSCSKKAFPSEKLAVDRIREIKLLRKEKGQTEGSRPMRAYQCQTCFQWHLTSVTATVRQERNAKRIQKLAREWEERLGVKEFFKKGYKR